MQIERIPVDGVRLGQGRRPVDASRLDALVESISLLGLRTPITVRIIPEMMDGDGVVHVDVPVLVAGAHRLEAARRLGWDYIDAVVVEGDETDARLWEIAENLHRAELTVQQRSEHIAEWVRLTKEKSSSAQVAPMKSRRADGRGGVVGEGINAAVRELGIDRTEAQRAVKIASISEEAKEAARAAGLDDNQSALLEVAKTAPEQQADRVREIAAAKAERRGRSEANAAFDKMTKEDACERLADLLSTHIPGEHWNALTALLYSVGARDVAKAFNRLNGAPVFDGTSAGRV